MSKTGEVKEKGFFWLLFNNKVKELDENVIEQAPECEELKKSEQRLKKMEEKYDIENFESFDVDKKPRKAKKVKGKEITLQKEEQNQINEEELER